MVCSSVLPSGEHGAALFARIGTKDHRRLRRSRQVSVAFSNYAMHVGQRYDHDWYDWCVFASGDEAELQHVRAVEYTLHSSFPDPVRTVSDREHRFPVMSNGWGSFRMNIRVIFDDEHEEFTSHFVRLDAEWPRKSPGGLSSQREASVYSVLTEEKYRWRSLEAIQKRTGLSVETIMAALDHLEAGNFVRKSAFRSIDKKELWGATSVVGVAPILKFDPSIQTH
jgi:transcription initiation factor IIF auxiliary subunit